MGRNAIRLLKNSGLKHMHAYIKNNTLYRISIALKQTKLLI